MEEKLTDTLQKWLIKADNDMKTAENGFHVTQIITDTLCFHCQQAAEKYLKAFLISRNIVPEKTHKIERLLNECMKVDVKFEEMKDAVALTEYAVELRYPDDFTLPSLEEAKEAYQLAVKVREFVLIRLTDILKD